MTFAVSTEPEVLRRPDGTRYPFALITDDASVYADTRTELVAYLIDGYADLPSTYEGDVASFSLRIDAAGQIATKLQAVIIAEGVSNGALDLRSADEDVINALYSTRGAAVSPFTGEWDGPVPLVLVSSDYSPYSRTPLPTGDVAFIDPTDETTFLNTLDALGVIDLYFDADEPAND